ncbi:MAG: hypothetical protein Kow00127_16150 [Bacteroidales bacterium]
MAEALWKLIKFSFVGLSGMGVDFGFTWLCKEIFRIPKYISNAIGFSLAATSNWYLNRIWTFHSTNPDLFQEFGFFFLISLIGLGLNTLLLWIQVSRFDMPFYRSKLVATILVTGWNFLANSYITFTI